MLIITFTIALNMVTTVVLTFNTLCIRLCDALTVSNRLTLPACLDMDNVNAPITLKTVTITDNVNSVQSINRTRLITEFTADPHLLWPTIETMQHGPIVPPTCRLNPLRPLFGPVIRHTRTANTARPAFSRLFKLLPMNMYEWHIEPETTVLIPSPPTIAIRPAPINAVGLMPRVRRAIRRTLLDPVRVFVVLLVNVSPRVLLANDRTRVRIRARQLVRVRVAVLLLIAAPLADIPMALLIPYFRLLVTLLLIISLLLCNVPPVLFVTTLGVNMLANRELRVVNATFPIRPLLHPVLKTT